MASQTASEDRCLKIKGRRGWNVQYHTFTTTSHFLKDVSIFGGEMTKKSFQKHGQRSQHDVVHHTPYSASTGSTAVLFVVLKKQIILKNREGPLYGVTAFDCRSANSPFHVSPIVYKYSYYNLDCSSYAHKSHSDKQTFSLLSLPVPRSHLRFAGVIPPHRDVACNLDRSRPSNHAASSLAIA